jgi:hypothetical protein
MREHTNMPAMVGLVTEHVAKHLWSNRPWLSPAVSHKLFDTATTITERFRKHLHTAGSAFCQSCTDLVHGAVCAVELYRDLQVRSGEPDPLGADVMHVREDGRNGADIAGWFGSPGGRVKTFEKNLVYAVVSGEDIRCGSAELSGSLESAHGHGSLLLAP